MANLFQPRFQVTLSLTLKAILNTWVISVQIQLTWYYWVRKQCTPLATAKIIWKGIGGVQYLMAQWDRWVSDTLQGKLLILALLALQFFWSIYCISVLLSTGKYWLYIMMLPCRRYCRERSEKSDTTCWIRQVDVTHHHNFAADWCDYSVTVSLSWNCASNTIVSF